VFLSLITVPSIKWVLTYSSLSLLISLSLSLFAAAGHWYQEPRGAHLLDAHLRGHCAGGYVQGEVSFVIPAQPTGRERWSTVKVDWRGSLESGLVQGASTLRLHYGEAHEVVYDLQGATRSKDPYHIVTEYNVTVYRRDEAEMAEYLGDSLPEEERVKLGTGYRLHCRMDLCYFETGGRFVDAVCRCVPSCVRDAGLIS
jgi:hypothetical protein